MKSGTYIAALSLLATGAAHADPLMDASRLCAAFNATSLSTGCEVNVSWGGERSVDVTIDTTGSEARKMCPMIVKMAAGVGANFQGQWQLRILSPYSGSKAIAVCQLK